MKASRALGLVLILAWSGLAHAGNGSSGVGMVAIDSGVDSRVANFQTIVREGDDLVDLSTGEKLLHLDHLSKSSLRDYGENLVPSTLGSLEGYEYLPDQSEIARKNNLWIICRDGQSCLRLTPLSSTNPKVMDIVGGLQGTGEHGKN